MSNGNDHAYTQFGIDEVYFHAGLDFSLLKKLHQRAVVTLDSNDSVALKYADNDMVLIFHKRQPNQSLIYRFLKSLYQKTNRESFIEAHTLFNEDELFNAIKTKIFVLVTNKDLT